jgi:Na+-transporting methylmalonyl-CoA/oxaloacetate decarboxylase gamma subunit
VSCTIWTSSSESVFFTLTLLVRADQAIGRAAGRAEPEERGGRDDDALVSDGDLHPRH